MHCVSERRARDRHRRRSRPSGGGFDGVRLAHVAALLAAVLVATLAFVSPAAGLPPDARSLVDRPQPGAPVGSVPAVDWSPCLDLPAGSPALDCARYEVPLNYDRPDGRTATLPLTRLKATGPGERLGSLFLNPGGPGGSGTGMPADPGFARLAQRFDLIGFDPRGAGASTPADRVRRSDELVARFDAAKARPDRRTGPRRALARAGGSRVHAARAPAGSCATSARITRRVTSTGCGPRSATSG